MIQPIVSSIRPITVIGGVQPAPATLSKALSIAPVVVAADGGADHALAAGIIPDAVIGDMDSLSLDAKVAFDGRLHQIDEQDSTDFDKTLRNIDAPLIIGVGFLGGRVDHTLAAMHVLLKYTGTPLILLGEDDLMFMAPRRIELDLPVGQRFSLMPFPEARVQTRGLRYEVNDAAMSVRDFIGTSNEVTAPRVEVYAMGGLAVILEPGALDAAVAGLTAAFRAQ